MKANGGRGGFDRWFAGAVLTALLSLFGCKTSSEAPTSLERTTTASSSRSAVVTRPRPELAKKAAAELALGAERRPVPERLVAIGDLHGDLSATLDVLTLAGAIDEQRRWAGGNLVVVQTGDQIDRGDDDRAILDLFTELAQQAKAAGGELISLNGNHETMNVSGDFRYVTEASFRSFEDIQASPESELLLQRLAPFQRGRAFAFLPGGPYARRLSERPVVAIVGDTLFVHGGVLLEHVEYGLGRINREVSAWLHGDAPAPDVIRRSDAPVWARDYSEPRPAKRACQQLGRVLQRTQVRRMVVGHTIQQRGISSACDERVYRIDVAMSSYYGGDSVAALEIARGGTPRILKQPKTRTPAGSSGQTQPK